MEIKKTLKITNFLAKVVLFVAFMMVPCTGAVEEDDEESEISLNWPAGGRPQLEVKAVNEVDDAVTITNWIFQNKQIQFEIPALPKWFIAKSLPTESVALVKNVPNSVERLGFSLYQKDEFLKKNNLDYINEYVELLKKTYGSKMTVLNEKDDYTVKNSFFILGYNYYLVDFTIDVAKKGVMRIRDHIVFLEKSSYELIIIRYEELYNTKESDYTKMENSLRFSQIIEEAKK